MASRRSASKLILHYTLGIPGETRTHAHSLGNYCSHPLSYRDIGTPDRIRTYMSLGVNELLPHQATGVWWTDWDSNPELLGANQACSHYHYPPIGVNIGI